MHLVSRKASQERQLPSQLSVVRNKGAGSHGAHGDLWMPQLSHPVLLSLSPDFTRLYNELGSPCFFLHISAKETKAPEHFISKADLPESLTRFLELYSRLIGFELAN